jgi:hypothetical protein
MRPSDSAALSRLTLASGTGGCTCASSASTCWGELQDRSTGHPVVLASTASCTADSAGRMQLSNRLGCCCIFSLMLSQDRHGAKSVNLACEQNGPAQKQYGLELNLKAVLSGQLG